MEYKHWKWNKYSTNNIKKTARQILDMREEINIEEEMVQFWLFKRV